MFGRIHDIQWMLEESSGPTASQIHALATLFRVILAVVAAALESLHHCHLPYAPYPIAHDDVGLERASLGWVVRGCCWFVWWRHEIEGESLLTERESVQP